MGLVEELGHGAWRAEGQAAQEADRDQEGLGPDGAGGCGVEMEGPGLGAFSPSLGHTWERGMVPAITVPGIGVLKASPQRWRLAGCLQLCPPPQFPQKSLRKRSGIAAGCPSAPSLLRQRFCAPADGPGRRGGQE